MSLPYCAKLPHSSGTHKQAGDGAQFTLHLPPGVTGTVWKGGPCADHTLQQHSSCCSARLIEEEMNGMFFGSSASYLPLQVGGDVSDLDLPAPAKTKPRVRVCRHTTAGGKRLSGNQMAAGESLPKHPASPHRAGAAHPWGKPFLPALSQSPPAGAEAVSGNAPSWCWLPSFQGNLLK